MTNKEFAKLVETIKIDTGDDLNVIAQKIGIKPDAMSKMKRQTQKIRPVHVNALKAAYPKYFPSEEEMMINEEAESYAPSMTDRMENMEELLKELAKVFAKYMK